MTENQENEAKKDVEESKEEIEDKADTTEKTDETKETESVKEESNEKYVWVDKNGKRPISYLMPTYIGVGLVFLVIWILIIVFAIMPAWDEYEESKKGGIEVRPAGMNDKPEPNLNNGSLELSNDNGSNTEDDK